MRKPTKEAFDATKSHPLVNLGVKVAPSQKAALRELATRAGKAPAVFVRETLDRILNAANEVPKGQGAPAPLQPATAAPVATPPATSQALHPTLVEVLVACRNQLEALADSQAEGAARLDRIEERLGDQEKARADQLQATRRGFEVVIQAITETPISDAHARRLREAFNPKEGR